MSPELSRSITESVVRRLAGDQCWQRGSDYFLHGHVESLDVEDGRIRASVRGNQDYSVELWADEGVLDYSCDCPAGVGGAFCKHCVATALAWLNRPAESKRRAAKNEVTLADAGKLLLKEDKEVIVQKLLEWAKSDARLRERLILHAARSTGGAAGLAAVRKTFEKAVRVRGYIGYHEARSYARDVNRAIDSIEQLLRDGQAAGVIELCESGLRMLTSAIGSIDDSDGYMSELRDRLQDIHYRACLEAPPEPVELAKRLFAWEMLNEFDVFFDAISRYGTILGPKGMKAYRELAEAEWSKLPVRASSSRESEWSRHFRITHIMESLARLSGDVEKLVGVMSRDLSHAYDYLKIAEVYREAGDHDKALSWAEQGLKAFSGRPDNRLREFAAEEYHRRNRHEDSMTLIWAEFLDLPGLESYRTLQEHAKKAGSWQEWRERALAEIRRRIGLAKEKTQRQKVPHWMRAGDDHSQLVEIFLYEHDPESAWREAREGGCSANLRLQLAAAREKDHPEDAAPIYFQQAEEAVVGARNSKYEDAVDLLVKAAPLMKRMGQSHEFIRQLEALKVKYKIKRNFIGLLEKKRKLLYGEEIFRQMRP